MMYYQGTGRKINQTNVVLVDAGLSSLWFFFSRWEQPQSSVWLFCSFSSFFLAFVFVVAVCLPYHWLLGFFFLLLQRVCTKLARTALQKAYLLAVLCTRETGTNKFAQMLTQRNTIIPSLWTWCWIHTGCLHLLIAQHALSYGQCLFVFIHVCLFACVCVCVCILVLSVFIMMIYRDDLTFQ